MKKLFILTLLPLAPIASQAAMVQVQYQSTIERSLSSESSLGAGEELTITILLDNGGDLEDNSWNSTHVTNITFQVGSGAGAFTSSFNPHDGGLFFASAGDFFTTDASGDVISSPTNWSGESPGGIRWWINGGNQIYMTSTLEVWDIDPTKNIVASNWNVAAVPEPSAALLGSIGALALLRRRRR